jgi:pimeloyl-ACP methyl ester carboxylesterase
MPITSQSGWNIYYETHGERSNPALLMILGLSHRLAHWGRLPSLFAERRFVIAFDCRGMGQSEMRDEPFTIADEMLDITAVLDAVGVPRCAVYGRSRGSMLAQEFALTNGDRVEALVLSGTGHRGPGSLGYSERVARAMNFGPGMSREEIFRTQDEAMASPGWAERDPEAFAYCLATDLEAPPRRFAVVRQQEALSGWSSHERLPSLRMPVLVLCGEDDGMTPPANGKAVADLVPGARFVSIPQCGHLPMLEQPQFVAKTVLAFLGDRSAWEGPISDGSRT